jgi:hypothetical protein
MSHADTPAFVALWKFENTCIRGALEIPAFVALDALEITTAPTSRQVANARFRALQ